MQTKELYQIKIYRNQPPAAPAAWPDWLQPKQTAPAQQFHQTLPQYQPTPLLSLPNLAAAGGVQQVLVKDEAKRFGLNAFKALGSSWAMACLLAERLDVQEAFRQNGLAALQTEAAKQKLQQQNIAFCTATDGNHGRGVAWAAQLFGCPAHVYMPAGTEPERLQNIAALGAEVCCTGLSYDESVALAASQAQANGWLLVQDTSLPDYTAIPQLIIQGYSTIAAELLEQIKAQSGGIPSHIFLQAGVGSMAGGMLAFLAQAFVDQGWPQPNFIIVEPSEVACCALAAQTGNMQAQIAGVQQTIMAGLNCGTPCSLIMPLLAERAAAFAACPDFVAAHGMRLAANPLPGDPAFVAGESGAPGLGLAALLLQKPQLKPLRQMLGLGAASVLLCLNTEGDTVPRIWQQAQAGAWPLPPELN